MMFGDLFTLEDLRKNIGLLNSIIWDFEPKQLMEPRCRISGSEQEEKKSTGFLFYIDKIAGMKPTLYLMIHTKSGYAETVGKIDEIPAEMLAEALSENKEKEYF